MMKKPAEVSKTMKTLSAWISGALRRALPKEVVETAKLHLIDTERMRYHVSYTAQQAAGLACLLRDPEHVEKAFDMAGMPAQNADGAGDTCRARRLLNVL